MSGLQKSSLTAPMGPKRGLGGPAARGRSTRGNRLSSRPEAGMRNTNNGSDQGHKANTKPIRGRGNNATPFSTTTQRGQVSQATKEAGDRRIAGAFRGLKRNHTATGRKSGETSGTSPFSQPDSANQGVGVSRPGSTRARGGSMGSRPSRSFENMKSNDGPSIDRSRDPRRRPNITGASIKAASSDNLDYSGRYEKLKQERARQRTKAIETGMMADPDQPMSLNKAITPTGTCTHMCPEFERVERIVQKMVDKSEKHLDPESGVAHNVETKMLKRFRRSAAGYDEQLPSDIRTPKTLLQTMNYMLRHVITNDEALGLIHKFVWDRTRSIRNDLSIQQVTQQHDVEVAVKCLERIARFHIVSLHLLSSPTNKEQFDHHQEREQLNNTLLSLLYYYDDNRGRIRFQNEDEFRAYYILFSIHDQRPDLEARVQKWPRELRESARVRVAMELFAAAGNTWEYQGALDAKRPNAIAQGFYSRFFNVVKSQSVSYLMACVAEVYFGQVRQTAIRSIWKAYCRHPLSQQHKNQEWTVDELSIALSFDDNDQVIEFCEEQDLELDTNSEGQLFLNWGNRPLDSVAFQPSSRQTFSESLVESKRCGRSLVALVLGMGVSQAIKHRMIDESLLRADSESAPRLDEDDSLFVSEDEGDERQPQQISPFTSVAEPKAQQPAPSPFSIEASDKAVTQPQQQTSNSPFGGGSPFGSPFDQGLSPAAPTFVPQTSANSSKPSPQPETTAFAQPAPTAFSPFPTLPTTNTPPSTSSPFSTAPPSFSSSFGSKPASTFSSAFSSNFNAQDGGQKFQWEQPGSSSMFGTPTTATSSIFGVPDKSNESKPDQAQEQSPFNAPLNDSAPTTTTTPAATQENKSPFSLSNSQSTPQFQDFGAGQSQGTPFKPTSGSVFGQQSNVFGQQNTSPPESGGLFTQLPKQGETGAVNETSSGFSSFPPSANSAAGILGSNSQYKPATNQFSASPSPFSPLASNASETTFPKSEWNQNLKKQTEIEENKQIEDRAKTESQNAKREIEKQEEEKKARELEAEQNRQRQAAEEAEAARKEAEKKEAEKKEAARRAIKIQQERREAAEREAARQREEKKKAAERARMELEELQAAQRDIARIEGAERKLAEQEAARRANVEGDIAKRKASYLIEEDYMSSKGKSKAIRLSPEEELSVEELLSLDRPKSKLSSSQQSQLQKSVIDEDELLLSSARMAANTLSQGRRLWSELPYFQESISPASTPVLGQSSIGSGSSSFDGSRAVVNGHDVALAPSTPLGLGRTLSRTEQRIRQTGGSGLAFKPITPLRRPSGKRKEKQKRPKR